MSIKTCETKHHDQIAFDPSDYDECPLCKAIYELDEMTTERDKYETEVGELDAKNAALQAEIDDLKNEIIELNEAADE